MKTKLKEPIKEIKWGQTSYLSLNGGEREDDNPPRYRTYAVIWDICTVSGTTDIFREVLCY